MCFPRLGLKMLLCKDYAKLIVFKVNLMRYLSLSVTTFFSVLLLTAELNAEGFYKWVNARGQVQYSDEPPAKGKAKKIKLPPITILESYGKQWKVDPLPVAKVQKPQVVTARVVKPKAKQLFRYQTLSFIAPKPNQVIKAQGGDVSAMLSIKPPLRKGHRLLYILDGKSVSKSVSRIANFPNLPNGTHTLMVKVVDSRGSTLHSSSALSFQVVR